MWTAQTPGYIWASPTVVDGVVYVGDLAGTVAGFDTNTGETLWQYQAQDNNRPSPAVTGNTLYIGSDDGHVYALTEH